MPQSANISERLIDVADIDPQHRHIVVFQLIDRLGPDNSLQLVADHDPKPLRFQLEAGRDSRHQWTYLEEGPDVRRVWLRQAPRAKADHA